MSGLKPDTTTTAPTGNGKGGKSYCDNLGGVVDIITAPAGGEGPKRRVVAPPRPPRRFGTSNDHIGTHRPPGIHGVCMGFSPLGVSLDKPVPDTGLVGNDGGAACGWCMVQGSAEWQEKMSLTLIESCATVSRDMRETRRALS